MVAIRESGNSQPVYFEFILSIAKKCQLITHKSAPTELSLFSSVRQSDLLKRFRVTEKVIIPSVKSFLYSLKLIFDNCKKYNQKNSIYYKNAITLEKVVEDDMKNLTDDK